MLILSLSILYSEHHFITLFLIYFMLLKLKHEIQSIEVECNIREKYSTQMDLIKLFFLIIFSCHFFGCGFYLLGTYEQHFQINSNWLDHFGITEKSLWQKYVVTFYWSAITSLTVGYGDYSP